jgi:hypothetical protein
MAAWRTSLSSAGFRLLQPSLPLLRRARDRWMREACAERRRHRSQPHLQSPATAEEASAMAKQATTRQAVSPAITLLLPTAQPTLSPQPALQLPAMSPQLASPPLLLTQSPQPAQSLPALSQQPAPPLRKQAKTVSEATQASSQAMVLAKKR